MVKQKYLFDDSEYIFIKKWIKKDGMPDDGVYITGFKPGDHLFWIGIAKELLDIDLTYGPSNKDRIIIWNINYDDENIPTYSWCLAQEIYLYVNFPIFYGPLPKMEELY
jgi:hypothetical protein